MAEAAVEDRPPQRFYCHLCNVQFESASANFICPHCSNGFVEELLDNPENNDEMVDPEDWEDDEMDIRDLLLASTSHSNDDRYRGSRNRPQDGNRSGRRYAVNSRSRIVRPRTLTRLASSNLRQNVPFENILQDFIINLGVGVNFNSPGNMQLFLGNPGDYAWGREGLDAIVTQLLNQMDSSGPPPLEKDVIDALPIVEVTQEQVDSKLQCSVCWEPFALEEGVRQLPCQHIYHEPCIRPWLELHGTCPICRQNLVGNNEQTETNSQDSGNNASNGGSSPFAVLRSLFQPGSNPSTSSSSSSSTAESSGTSRSRSTSNNSDSAMM